MNVIVVFTELHAVQTSVFVLSIREDYRREYRLNNGVLSKYQAFYRYQWSARSSMAFQPPIDRPWLDFFLIKEKSNKA